MGENDGGASGNVGGSGTVEAPTWLQSLPDDLKGNEVLAQFPTIGDASKALITYKTSEGKMVSIPGDDATPEQRAAFYTKLGRPETADKYTITKPADLPEGIQYSPEVETAFKDHAHKLGFSDAQAKATYNWYYGLVKAGHEQQLKAEKEATDAAVNSLKDEWKGDAFKSNSELARRAFTKFGGEKPEVLKFIRDTKVNGVALGDHPTFLKIFAEIGKAISEDSLSAGGRGGMGGEQSDEEKAKARFPNTTFE